MVTGASQTRFVAAPSLQEIDHNGRHFRGNFESIVHGEARLMFIQTFLRSKMQ
jgi:hypothetical protein